MCAGPWPPFQKLRRLSISVFFIVVWVCLRGFSWGLGEKGKHTFVAFQDVEATYLCRGFGRRQIDRRNYCTLAPRSSFVGNARFFSPLLRGQAVRGSKGWDCINCGVAYISWVLRQSGCEDCGDHFLKKRSQGPFSDLRSIVLCATILLHSEKLYSPKVAMLLSSEKYYFLPLLAPEKNYLGKSQNSSSSIKYVFMKFVLPETKNLLQLFLKEVISFGVIFVPSSTRLILSGHVV